MRRRLDVLIMARVSDNPRPEPPEYNEIEKKKEDEEYEEIEEDYIDRDLPQRREISDPPVESVWPEGSDQPKGDTIK